MNIRGFTLIEVMITVVILVLVMTWGIPNYRTFILHNRIQQTSNSFIADLSYARSESIKRGVAVSVCATQNNTFSNCGNNNDWSNGWIVFVNPDENAIFANNATEILLKTHEAPPVGISLTSAPNTNIATFRSSGFPGTGSGNTSFTITAAGCLGNQQRMINLSATGDLTVNLTACP